MKEGGWSRVQPALVLVPARVADRPPIKPRNVCCRRTPRPASRRAARLRLLKTRRLEKGGAGTLGVVGLAVSHSQGGRVG